MPDSGLSDKTLAEVFRALLDDEVLRKAVDEGKGDSPIQARRALMDIISVAVLQLSRLEGTTETKKDQLKHFNDAIAILNAPAIRATESTKEVLQDGVGEIQKAICSVQSRLDELCDRVKRRDIVDLLEPGPMRDRVEQEYRREKTWIAKYLAKTVFTETVRCFLQASTTLVLLADELREQGLRPRSLIHTNSTAFPYLMLGKSSTFQVYTLCGKKHDAKCCGWLFDLDDTEAEKYLRSLFPKGRETNPLDLAVITPQFMTVDGRVCFEREDTKNLVNVLMEEAPRVLVLSPGQRIFRNQDEAEKMNRGTILHFMELGRSREGQNIELVVAGELTQLDGKTSELERLKTTLRAKCTYRPGAEGEFCEL